MHTVLKLAGELVVFAVETVLCLLLIGGVLRLESTQETSRLGDSKRPRCSLADFPNITMFGFMPPVDAPPHFKIQMLRAGSCVCSDYEVNEK